MEEDEEMTIEKDNEPTKPGEFNKILIRVKTKTGDTNHHIIELPSSYQEASETINLFLDEISAAMERKRASLWLLNPSAIYNASQIVFIEFDFVTPERWKEMIESVKRSI